jgi:sporulation protein YlmC with PRC-barrel domain
MLISHVRPSELWGKRVYDNEGHYLGSVIGVGFRRGAVRKVVIQPEGHGQVIRLLPPPETRVDGETILVPTSETGAPSQLRLLH